MSGLSFFAAATSASPPAVEISLDLEGMAAAVEGYSILGAEPDRFVEVLDGVIIVHLVDVSGGFANIVGSILLI
jgi:hypothetical protein